MHWAELDLVEGAIEETLRFESPVVNTTQRCTTEPVVVGGVEIPAGQIVWVAVGSANRDGERFDAPDALAVPECELRWRFSPVTRGLERLPVRLG